MREEIKSNALKLRELQKLVEKKRKEQEIVLEKKKL